MLHTSRAPQFTEGGLVFSLSLPCGEGPRPLTARLNDLLRTISLEINWTNGKQASRTWVGKRGGSTNSTTAGGRVAPPTPAPGAV